MFLKRLWILLLPLWIVQGQTVPKLTLDDLLQQVKSGNLQIQAQASNARAAALKAPQAGALPDPMISLNMLNLPLDNFVFDQEPMSGKQIALKQSFPFPGKLGLKEDGATAAAQAATANWQETEARLIKEARLAWYNLYFTDQAISTIGKNIRLVKEFVTIAEKKYAVGKGLQQDVLKAQVELSKLEEQLINFQQQREQLEAALNTLRNHAVIEPIGSIESLPVRFQIPERDSLSSYSAKNRKLISMWRERIRQATAQFELARKSYLPDFSVFAAYTQRDILQSGMGGVDFLSAGISMNIPLYFRSKQDKLVQEKQATLQQVKQVLQEAQNQVARQLDDALSSLERNQKLYDLYRNGIVPQATQSLQSALIGYQTDKVDFLTLINNQKTLFNYELQVSRIASALNKDVATIEFVSGYPLQAILR